jgi:tripartite-type tricarboxylate transporter receptor subunit TctC
MYTQLLSKRLIVILLVLGFLCPEIIFAQVYPSKPVTLVIPVGPGGSLDLTFRSLASAAMDHLGQPFIIQLKPGGSGAIASDFVANAPADGYTLLVGSNRWTIGLPVIEGRSKGLEFWEPVCRVIYFPTIIVIRPDAPFKTFKEMVAWAKANPRKLVFANTGPWGSPDVAWKVLMKETDLDFKNIPYDGGGKMLLSVLGGHSDACGATPVMYFPYRSTGKLIAVLYLGDKRRPDLPEVPTSIEEGLSENINMVSRLWGGILAPKGTPRPIVDKLAATFKKMTEDQSVISMLETFGSSISYLGPEDFAKVLRNEGEVYKEIGKIHKK